MRVRELIDILSDQPPDAEVELVLVQPIADGDDDITVDRYSVEGVMPWMDEDERGNDTEMTVWLIGGEDSDVDAFFDQLEADADHDH
jgi:hypothetical protein